MGNGNVRARIWNLAESSSAVTTFTTTNDRPNKQSVVVAAPAACETGISVYVAPNGKEHFPHYSINISLTTTEETPNRRTRQHR